MKDKRYTNINNKSTKPSNEKSLKKALGKVYLAQSIEKKKLGLFKKEFQFLLDDKIDKNKSEEFNKNLIIKFLNSVYYGEKYYINIKENTDLVIYNRKDTKYLPKVLIEVKRTGNTNEMASRDNLNAKSFQKIILYYLREQVKNKDWEFKNFIITNIYEWFIFDAVDFKNIFLDDKNFLSQFEKFNNGKLESIKTDFLYKEFTFTKIEKIKSEIPYTYFDIRDYKSSEDSKLEILYKILSPTYLLKIPIQQATTQLNKNFYAELLHIIGLEETKEKFQKKINRKSERKRDNGSLIENSIEQIVSNDKLESIPNLTQYGKNKEEQLYNIALELSITWINRILFLKLLEVQIINYHKKEKKYQFLTQKKISGYGDLHSLFFQILAIEKERRKCKLKDKFSNVPYLNSSLFEYTKLEKDSIAINTIKDVAKIEIHTKSILKKNEKFDNKELNPLDYLLDFLNAYDFGSKEGEEFQNGSKPLISTTILGLFFEKINGYKDGLYFIPSVIITYMCKETISKIVLQKFNEEKGWNCNTMKDLYNEIKNIKEANEIFNSIKICDPAVGSGHFLVSALNEMISLKSELGILNDINGKKLKDYKIEVVNDELIIRDKEGEIFQYFVPKTDLNQTLTENQRVQETIFYEKKLIIENCLFGVDINQKSVNICQLRLWIELMKHTYYNRDTKSLEILPNIDINIKCGNSLLSRFNLDEDLKNILRVKNISIKKYKDAVSKYKNATSKEDRKKLEKFIKKIKRDIKLAINFNNKNIRNIKKFEKKLDNLTKPNLFELSKKEKQQLDNKKKEIKKNIDKYKANIDDINNNKIYENAIEWRFDFPEVLNNNGNYVGFDAIIGNPPYIRVLMIDDLVLETKYRTAYQSAKGNFDLYTLFTEKSHYLIKENGLINFIMPINWTYTEVGKGLRSFLSKKKSISKIIDLSSFNVFEVCFFTAIQFFKKNSEFLEHIEISNTSPKNLEKSLRIINEKSFNKIAISTLTGEKWKLSGKNEITILNKLKKQKRRISEIFRIFQGLGTRKNNVYFLYDCFFDKKYITGFSKQLNNRIQVEIGLVKPLLKGSDIQRYKSLKTDKCIIFPYKKENNSFILFTEDELKTQFPKGYEYLKQNRKVLSERERGKYDLDGKWFRYGRTYDIRPGVKKIVGPDISQGGNLSYDCNGEFYFSDTIYGYIKNNFIKENYKFWLALFNSQLFWFFLQNIGYTYMIGVFRFITNYVNLFPIPKAIPSSIYEIVLINSKKILDIKEKNSEANVDNLEDTIDREIYKLYNLTDEEIKVVESYNKIRHKKIYS